MNFSDWHSRVGAATEDAISDMKNATEDFLEWAQWAKKELARQKRAEKSGKPLLPLVSVIVAAPPADNVQVAEISARPTRNARNAALSNIRKQTLLPLNRKLRRPGSDEQDDPGYLSGVSSCRSTASFKTSAAEEEFTKPKPTARKRAKKDVPVQPSISETEAVQINAEPQQKTSESLVPIDNERVVAAKDTGRVVAPPLTPRSVKDTIKQFEEMTRNSQEDAKRTVIQRTFAQVFPSQEKTILSSSVAVQETEPTSSLSRTLNAVSPTADHTVNSSVKASEADGTYVVPNLSNVEKSVPNESEQGTFVANQTNVGKSVNQSGQGTFVVNQTKSLSPRAEKSDCTYNVPRQTRSGSKCESNAQNGTYVKTPNLSAGHKNQASSSKSSENVTIDSRRTRSKDESIAQNDTYVKTPNLPAGHKNQASSSKSSDNLTIDSRRTRSKDESIAQKTSKLSAERQTSSDNLDSRRTRSKSRDGTLSVETPEMDESSHTEVLKTVIKRAMPQEYKESTPRILEASGFVLNETSPAFSPVLCASASQNVVNETAEEIEVLSEEDEPVRTSLLKDSKLDKSIGESSEKKTVYDGESVNEAPVPVGESSPISRENSKKVAEKSVKEDENVKRLTRQGKVIDDIVSQGDSSYLTAEKSVSFAKNVTFEDEPVKNVRSVKPAVKRTKTRKAKKNSDIFETSTDLEVVEEKPRVKRTRTRKAKAESLEKYETADESLDRPVKRTKKGKKKTKASKRISCSVDADISEFTDLEGTRNRTVDRKARASSKRSADMAEIFANAPAETVQKKKYKRGDDDDEFLVPAPPAIIAKPPRAQPKEYDCDGNPISSENRSARTRTLKAPSVDVVLPEVTAASDRRPVRTRTKVRRFGEDETDQSVQETETTERVTRTKTKARLVEIDVNKPKPVASKISRLSKGRRASKVINQALLKKLQLSDKKTLKTPLSAIGKMAVMQHATVLRENQLSAQKMKIAKVLIVNKANEDDEREREAKLKTKQLKEELAARKKEEELEKKRKLIKLKNDEKSQRAMLNRAKMEEDRQAKLHKQELEQQRILQEKQRQQEMEDKRARERQEENRKVQEMHKIAKAKAAQARADAERKLAGQKSNPYEGRYLPKNHNDLGLEEELSEGSDGEEPPSPKKTPTTWASVVKSGNLVNNYISVEQLSKFMPMLSKTPNVHKMFNMSPTRRLKRTSSAIWNATLLTPDMKRI